MATKKKTTALFTIRVEAPKKENDVYLVMEESGDRVRYNGRGFDYYGICDGEEIEPDGLDYSVWFDESCADGGAEEVSQLLTALAALVKKTTEQKKD